MISGAQLPCEARVLLLLELRNFYERAFLDRFRVQAVQLRLIQLGGKTFFSSPLQSNNDDVRLSAWRRVTPDRMIYFFPSPISPFSSLLRL